MGNRASKAIAALLGFSPAATMSATRNGSSVILSSGSG
jgi:hypothetical protein